MAGVRRFQGLESKRATRGLGLMVRQSGSPCEIGGQNYQVSSLLTLRLCNALGSTQSTPLSRHSLCTGLSVHMSGHMRPNANEQVGDRGRERGGGHGGVV